MRPVFCIFTVCGKLEQKGSRFANAGGSWNNTSDNGLFALNLNNAVSNSNTNIGGSQY